MQWCKIDSVANNCRSKSIGICYIACTYIRIIPPWDTEKCCLTIDIYHEDDAINSIPIQILEINKQIYKISIFYFTLEKAILLYYIVVYLPQPNHI